MKKSLFVLATVAAFAAQAQTTDTLKKIKDSGSVTMGVRESSGALSFTLGDVHPHDLSTILDEAGICIRAGHHCAQPLMRRLGVSATARASFWVYNDQTDIDALIEALARARSIFGLAGV